MQMKDMYKHLITSRDTYLRKDLFSCCVLFLNPLVESNTQQPLIENFSGLEQGKNVIKEQALTTVRFLAIRGHDTAFQKENTWIQIMHCSRPG